MVRPTADRVARPASDGVAFSADDGVTFSANDGVAFSANDGVASLLMTALPGFLAQHSLQNLQHLLRPFDNLRLVLESTGFFHRIILFFHLTTAACSVFAIRELRLAVICPLYSPVNWAFAPCSEESVRMISMGTSS